MHKLNHIVILGEKLDSFGELLKAYSIDGTEPLPSLPAVDSSVADDKPKVKQESTSYDEKISPPPSPGGSDISSASSSKPGGRRSKLNNNFNVLSSVQYFCFMHS